MTTSRVYVGTIDIELSPPRQIGLVIRYTYEPACHASWDDPGSPESIDYDGIEIYAELPTIPWKRGWNQTLLTLPHWLEGMIEEDTNLRELILEHACDELEREREYAAEMRDREWDRELERTYHDSDA